MKRFLCAILFVSALAGCDDVRQTVGLGRNNPDEFTVVTNPSLAMPPDFELRPPQIAAQGPNTPAPAPVVAAQATGAPVQVENADSPGVEAFLAQAKAADAKDDIRATIDKESEGVMVKDKTFVDKLMVWQPDTTPPDPAVNASAEAVRVDDAKANGGLISGDGAKYDGPKEKAPLEGVFN